MIPYSCQDLSEDDIRSVLRVLRSDFLTQGPEVPAFEQALAARCGVAEAVAVNSATSALHLACLLLDVGPGDRVWTSPISFVASANCALYCGAEVDFVDVDQRTGNMDAGILASKLAQADHDGTLPAVIIPVHYAGQPCDMRAIGELARRYGVRVIEDASHALGATFAGSPVGNCEYSDITVFSFHPVKMITTGEGGALVTNDAGLAEQARVLRTHGITRDPAKVRDLDSEPWRYEQVALGFNYRMTDLEAALGLSQLSRLDEFLEARRRLAREYIDAFRDTPVRTLLQAPDSNSSWHLMVVRVRPDIRGDVFRSLRAADIGVNVHYIPIHLQPYYRQLGFGEGYCPAAEAFYQASISIPLHTRLTPEDQRLVIDSVTSCEASAAGRSTTC